MPGGKGRLVFVGLGLSMDHLTKHAERVLKEADTVFVEGYTSYYHPGIQEVFTRILSLRNVLFIERSDLEEESGRIIWERLEKGETVALAVIGDPFIATTHVTLKIDALRKGYSVEYVPGINIFSYSIAKTGLFNYKFGPSATIVYPRDGILSEHPYNILLFNRKGGYHTFFFLDLDQIMGPLDAREAIRILLRIEEQRKERLLDNNKRVIVLERLGWPDERIMYVKIRDLLDMKNLKPPHSIIIPENLHFMEEEALEVYKI